MPDFPLVSPKFFSRVLAAPVARVGCDCCLGLRRTSLMLATALVGGLALVPALSVLARAEVINGVVTVIGSGGGTQASPWNLDSENLFVGNGSGSEGALTVSDGGVVEAFGVQISNDATAKGTVTVTGAGSAFTLSTFAEVGLRGEGTLTISDGGLVESQDLRLGYYGGISGSNGTVIVTGAGSRLNVTSNVSVGNFGDASLAIRNGGVVVGSTGYIGLYTGSTGLVSVSGRGSQWNNGADLYVGNAGAGALTISNGGEVEVGGTVHVASNIVSTGTLNIGAAAGSAAVAAGTLDASAVEFGGGTGKIVFNHTDTDYTFGASITSALGGAGSVDVLSGTTILTGTNTYNGDTTISGGRLIVNGSLGDVTLSGGTLGGSGTVGTVVAGSGSTISPGNSIGTLTVEGNVTFASGSTYAVEVDAAGNADRIAAEETFGGVESGTVDIASDVTLDITAQSGDYAPSTTYTILDAAGGITGSFGATNVNFAFLDASLGYEANSVTLTLERNQATFASVAKTPNQKGVASSIDGMDEGAPLSKAVSGLSEKGAEEAFNDLSGEANRSTSNVRAQQTNEARSTAQNRLRTATGGVVPAEQAQTSFHGKGVAPSLDGRMLVWGTAYGSWGAADGTENAARMEYAGGGLFAGVDTDVAGGWRAGLLAGLGGNWFDAAERSYSAEAASYTLGAYAGGQFDALGVRLGTSLTLDDMNTRRDVRVGSFSNTLKARYLATTAQAFGEAGYTFDTAFARVEPFAGAALIHLHTPRFTETGGAAALTSSAQSDVLGAASLGLRADRRIAIEDGPDLTLFGSLGWEHAIGDLTPTSTMRFSTGNAFKVTGTPIDRDVLQVSAGLSLNLTGAAGLHVSYDGELAASAQKHSLSAKLSARF